MLEKKINSLDSSGTIGVFYSKDQTKIWFNTCSLSFAYSSLPRYMHTHMEWLDGYAMKKEK